ncbi:MAG: response regulator [Myxococcota bacterium]
MVDDSVSMRRLLAELLAERGYEVLTSGTGETALRLHEEQPFDLMLVDWTLPGISGLDVCRAVRRRPSGEDIALLVVTGRDRPEDLHAVMDAGASDYIAKPIDPDMLRTRLLVATRLATAARRRRRGQQALLRAEEAFQRLVQSAPDAIYVAGADGKLAYANERLVAYLGYDSVEALRDVAEESLLHPDDHPAARAERIGALNSGQPTPPRELRLVRRDGHTVTGESVTIPIDFAGRASALRMIRDVTERKEMQAQLLLADRMASVGTLAAGVAHELNNPLAYVLSNLRLSREELEHTELTAERVHLVKLQLEEAAHGARRMSDIVRDLKTFSRGDDEDQGAVDVPEVLASSINMCWNELRHRARLEKEIGRLPIVRGNESRLGQVFLNLLINAAQAMPEDRAGENVIRVVAGVDDAGWARVEIVDTGRGIAPEHLGRIFDPFFTTKPVAEGTGLGLAICRNIVTQTGGELSVKSEVDVGTTFTVRLPPAQGVAAAPTLKPVKNTEPPTQHRARVLVIDDEHLVGRSISRALRQHEVDVLSRGNEAIERLMQPSGAAYDLVFCDLMMPEVSGMEVYEAVHAVYPDRASRFVFMTGGAFTPRARAFLEQIENRCIDKPFDLATLRAIALERAGSAQEPNPGGVSENPPAEAASG